MEVKNRGYDSDSRHALGRAVVVEMRKQMWRRWLALHWKGIDDPRLNLPSNPRCFLCNTDMPIGAVLLVSELICCCTILFTLYSHRPTARAQGQGSKVALPHARLQDGASSLGKPHFSRVIAIRSHPVPPGHVNVSHPDPDPGAPRGYM
eukprot:scaffold25478_cov101-Isochrysis_galbana.AAC.7